MSAQTLLPGSVKTVISGDFSGLNGHGCKALLPPQGKLFFKYLAS